MAIAFFPDLDALDGDILSAETNPDGTITVLLCTENFKLEQGTWSVSSGSWLEWQRLGPRGD